MQDWSVEGGYSRPSKIKRLRSALSVTRIARSTPYLWVQGVLVLAALFACIGIFFVGSIGALTRPIYFYKEALSASIAQDEWKVTTAVISTVSTERSGSRWGTWYCHKLAYKYSVGETEYVGHRERFGYTCSSSSRPPVYVRETVRVYYDPNNPSQSSLSLTVPFFDLIGVIVLALLFVASIAMYVRLVKKSRAG